MFIFTLFQIFVRGKKYDLRKRGWEKYDFQCNIYPLIIYLLFLLLFRIPIWNKKFRIRIHNSELLIRILAGTGRIRFFGGLLRVQQKTKMTLDYSPRQSRILVKERLPETERNDLRCEKKIDDFLLICLNCKTTKLIFQKLNKIMLKLFLLSAGTGTVCLTF